MRLDGRWIACDDEVVRPVLLGSALAADGNWKNVRFLLDSGADRTVLSAAALADLGFLTLGLTTATLSGIGGITDAAVVATQISFLDQSSKPVLFRGPFHAVTELETLDFSVLGPDVTDHFASIIDRPGDTVCLISQRHRYRIEVV